MLFLNIFIPGFGTILNSCMGTEKCNVTSFFVGLMQFLLSYIFIGWIWSIWWGIIMLDKSRDL